MGIFVKARYERTFVLEYPGNSFQAIAFVRDVERSLARVSFIKNLHLEGARLSDPQSHDSQSNDPQLSDPSSGSAAVSRLYADLCVNVPLLGEQRLDFCSTLVPHPRGADLIASDREGRAWAAVSGEARVDEAVPTKIHYYLCVVAHINLPLGEAKWGSRAFTKMLEATSERSLERVAAEFPTGLRAAMP